jgi:putative SOS response-associated peptidase YedK
MCGRFTLTVEDVASLAREWAAEVEEALADGWRPRFNVAPGDRHPLLVAHAGRRRLISATFGWRVAGESRGLLLNARAETAATLPTFREAFRARRAAVPADGFYEWEGPRATRRPTWFHDGGRTLWFGAITTSDAGLPAFVILTTEARAPVRALHDRMPLLVPAALLDAWLSGHAPSLPAPADGALAGRRVSERANSIRNDDAACLAPAEPPAQGSLF